MGQSPFNQNIERVSNRPAELQRTPGDSTPPDPRKSPTIEELQHALEDLRVADEELRQQADELASGRTLLEAERRRYHDLFEFAPEPYLITDERGIILEANRAACTLLNMARPHLLRYPLANRIAEEDRRSFRQGIRELARGGRISEWRMQVQVRDHDHDPGNGDTAPGAAHISVAITAEHGQDPNGPVIRWVVRDIADRCETERALRDAQDELERRVQERTAELAAANARLREEVADHARAEAALARRTGELAESNAELQDFAYIASHDLKEPLRGISNYARFLSDDYADTLDDEGRDKLETLSRLAKRMYALLDSLLEYSRVGRTQVQSWPVSMSEVLADTVQSMKSWLDEEQARVVEVGVLPTIHCNASRASQVLRNLISNGVKYNEAALKVIEIGVLDEDAGGRDDDWPVLFVRDNGIGIPPRHHEAVFAMFKRLHGRDRYGGGTGAGLALAKRIVTRHGGRMWVDSEQGNGTTFYFTLGPNA